MGYEELVVYAKCVWLGAAWMRGLGLDVTNPVGTGGVLDVCM